MVVKLKQATFSSKLQSGTSFILITLWILQYFPSTASAQDHENPNPETTALNRTALYIGAFFPLGGGWNGSGVVPVVEMALDDINSRSDILPGYELKMVWNDTQCEAGLGTRVLIDQIFSKPQKLMLLGGGCSTATQAIAATSYHWNMVTISYAASSPALSNRKVYPYFYRTHMTDAIYNPARVRLMKDYDWNRVATIHENHELFSLAIDDLHNILKKENITLISSESFPENPHNQVVNLMNQDAKIIVANMYETKARRMFCEAYKHGITAKNGYVWMLVGWYTDKWWEVADNTVPCTKTEMREAVFGYISVESVPLGDPEVLTVANITSADYETRLRERLKWPRYQSYDWNTGAPFGYDAAWAIALMLNRTMNELKAKRFADNSTRRLEDFNYDDKEMAAMFFRNLNRTNFIGVTGPVSFEHGDRVGITKIEQLQVVCEDNWHPFQDTCYKLMLESVSWREAEFSCLKLGAKLGHADNIKDAEVKSLLSIPKNEKEISKLWVGKSRKVSCNTDVTSDDCPAWNLEFGRCNHFSCTTKLPFICQKNGDYQEREIGLYNTLNDDLKWISPIRWPENRVPRDRTVTKMGIPMPVFVTFTCIACLGISLAVIFLGFNMKFRNLRSVRLSSPYLNNLIIFGSIIMYTWIILYGFSIDLVNKQSFSAVCQIRHWFLSIGFILGFGAMFSKTWRVYRVALFKKPKRVKVSDTHLFLMVLGFLCFDILLLIIWQVADPMSIQLPDKTDTYVPNQIRYYNCDCNKYGLWLAGVAGYKGLLLLFGAFLAWETRQVNIDELNDSKLIGMSVYTVVILSGVALAVSMTVTSNPALLYMFVACIVFFCTSMTLIIIFVPKMVGVYKYPDGKSGDRTSSVGVIRQSTILNTENIDNLKAKIEQLEEDIQRSKEDVHKSKEELHRSKEELHRSKEELQRSKEQTICNKCGVNASNNNNDGGPTENQTGTWF